MAYTDQSDPQLLRDPFAWRECLTPPQNVSPATSARGGSRVQSRSGTPRDANTPPLSPGTPATSTPKQISAGDSARSTPGSGSQSLSRRDPYHTPQSSARQSEYASLYDSASVCGTARGAADFDTVYEDNSARLRRGSSTHSSSGGSKPRGVAAAAFDTFLGSDTLRSHHPLDQVAESAEPQQLSLPAAKPVSLEPRHVFSAARHGKHKEVEGALQEGFDPDTVDGFGNTIYHVACQNGNKRIAKAAIKYGGNMDAQNKKGNTGLHFLFAYGYEEIAEYFIAKGASEEIANESGNRPRDGLK